VTAEAMEELAHRVNGKGRGFFYMERTKAGEGLRPGFLQHDVGADNPDNVCLLLNELGEV